MIEVRPNTDVADQPGSMPKPGANCEVLSPKLDLTANPHFDYRYGVHAGCGWLQASGDCVFRPE